MKKKSIWAAFLGHALEHYDVTLYGFFAAHLSTVFFASSNSKFATFSSLLLFASGFFLRPLGGIFFGYLGDYYGRKIALLWSVLLVSFPTLLIGILPSYEKVGLLSAIILLISRLVQGLCVGGEYSGASIFVTEHTPITKRGLYGSILCSTGFFGAVLGTGIGAICLKEGMPDSSWRFPFILGGIFGIIGFLMRKTLEETPVFLKVTNSSPISPLPLLYILKKYIRNVLCTIGIGANGLIPLYMTTIYINIILAAEFKYSSAYILLINSGIMILWMLLLPIMGFISDKIGHEKIMSYSSLLTILLSFPLFIFLNTRLSLYNVLVFQITLTVISAAFVGPIPSFMPTLFPTQVRFRGVAFSYTLGQAIFGGTAPLIAKSLVEWTGKPMAPALYLCFGGILGWLGVNKRLPFQT